MVPLHRRFFMLAVLLGALGVASPLRAVTYHLAADVPSTLGGTEVTPTAIALTNGTAYSLQQETGIPIGALARLMDGRWLIAPSEPVPAPGGGFWSPRDLIAVDPMGGVSLYLDGAAAGVPDGVRIDALLIAPTGELALSFDVPVTIGGGEFGPSDIVQYDGGTFLLVWDAASEVVPAYANLVGFELTSEEILMTFDVPATLGTTEALPGDLVGWQSTTSFVTFHRDPAWPPGAQLRDFVLPPPGGVVPDGQAGTVPLTITPAADGQLTLSWGDSCAPGDVDYEVYAGTVGSYFSHRPILCSTGGATSVTLAPGRGNIYYLVVSKNAYVEGSYGRRSDGTERPPATTPCVDQSLLLVCQ